MITTVSLVNTSPHVYTYMLLFLMTGAFRILSHKYTCFNLDRTAVFSAPVSHSFSSLLFIYSKIKTSWSWLLNMGCPLCLLICLTKRTLLEYGSQKKENFSFLLKTYILELNFKVFYPRFNFSGKKKGEKTIISYSVNLSLTHSVTVQHFEALSTL